MLPSCDIEDVPHGGFCMVFPQGYCTKSLIFGLFKVLFLLRILLKLVLTFGSLGKEVSQTDCNVKYEFSGNPQSSIYSLDCNTVVVLLIPSCGM